jgi:hypothetical protein
MPTKAQEPLPELEEIFSSFTGFLTEEEVGLRRKIPSRVRSISLRHFPTGVQPESTAATPKFIYGKEIKICGELLRTTFCKPYL